MPGRRQAQRAREPSVVEYARFHGIARDYLTEGPLQPDELPRAPPFLRQELADPPNAPKVEWPEDVQLNERLELDMLGARALAFACRAPPLSALPEASIQGRMHRVRNLKAELPFLRSDNELDMIKFMRRKEKALSKFKFPLEDLNDEEDEGLAWPSKCWERLGQIKEQLDSEKLQMTRADFLYFQACLKDDSSENDREHLVEQVLKEAEDKATRKHVTEPVTPILLPMDPPLNPFPDPRSSSPTNNIRYFSSDTNSAAAEAEALEDRLVRQDTLVPPEGSKYDPMLYNEPDAELLDIFSNMKVEIPNRKRKAAEHQVEVPLTPRSTYPSSTEKKQKTVAFADDLTEYIAANPGYKSESREALPSEFLHPNDRMEDDQDYDAFFHDEVAPIASRVALRTEQEQLSEVDTLRRVEVPLMSFSLPVPPWEKYGGITLAAQRQLLRQCAEEPSKPPKGRSGSLEVKLRWNPFISEPAKAVPNDEIRYDRELEALVTEVSLDKVVTPEDLAWKPDGPRVLDDLYEEEDDLEPVSFEPGDEIGSLVRKRKMEMLEPDPSSVDDPLTKQHRPCQPESIPGVLKSDTQEIVKKAPDEAQTAGRSMFGSIFSASKSLSAFMKVHSGITISPPQSNPEPAKPALRPPPELSKPSIPAREFTKTPLIPLPKVMPPASFVISTQLSTHQRSLVSKIQSLYPTAMLIERSPLAPPPSIFPDRPQKQPKHPEPLPAMLLAPGTALLLPTFTALAQRPLPGAQPTPNNFFPLQLTRVALRCEKVFVCVWRGSHSTNTIGEGDAPQLSDAEALALADLSGRATRLDSDVDVALVPDGDGDGEEALARWIVRLMARFGQQQQQQPGHEERQGDVASVGTKVLQDETLWEQLLRRAGMDAFAAQVVLDALKEKDCDEKLSSESSDEKRHLGAGTCGLAAFVQMSQEDRVRRFGGAMGGRHVLDRVGQVLDQRWVCVGEGSI